MDFMSKRKLFFGISIAIILIGIVSTIAYGGLNQGIDFVGGTLVHVDFDQKISVQNLRQFTDEIDPNASIIHAGDEQKQVFIKTKLQLSQAQINQLLDNINEQYQVLDSKSETFGPSMGNEIKRNALISVIIATIGILIYVTYRFEWRFGVSAIIALIHDVLIALTVYSIFRIPINSSFVAAMLTIVGYSINDTIVVFDRIRENLKTAGKKDYAALVNESVSQTIVRSINTSLTTLIAIVTLYVLGVEAIKDFALPLIVGIIAGTYSSIFIASPIWSLFRKKTA